jgi:hypothetical protein
MLLSEPALLAWMRASLPKAMSLTASGETGPIHMAACGAASRASMSRRCGIGSCNGPGPTMAGIQTLAGAGVPLMRQYADAGLEMLHDPATLEDGDNSVEAGIQ